MGKRGPLPKANLPVDMPCIASKPTKADEARERRYRAEDALRAINRAEEIRGDKQLMGDVKNLAKEQMTNLKRIVK